MYAWILVLAGLSWFVVVSPKNPVAFFDAALRDKSALDALETGKHDQALTGKELVFHKISETRNAMQRIELLYDMTNDSARVQKERSTIICGAYYASPKTQDVLIKNDNTYSLLQTQLEQLRVEQKATRSTGRFSTGSRDDKKEVERLKKARIQKDFNRAILRQFQAKIFWRRRK